MRNMSRRGSMGKRNPEYAVLGEARMQCDIAQIALVSLDYAKDLIRIASRSSIHNIITLSRYTLCIFRLEMMR